MSDSSDTRATRPITAPASQPDQPLAAADVSQLAAVTMRLAMELCTLRERVHSQEALLQKNGLLPPQAVDHYVASGPESKDRADYARELIEALSRDLSGRSST
jgi:hypothetical protein